MFLSVSLLELCWDQDKVLTALDVNFSITHKASLISDKNVLIRIDQKIGYLRFYKSDFGIILNITLSKILIRIKTFV